jgi:hypothetical protein
MDLSGIGQALWARGHMLKIPQVLEESDGFDSRPLCHRRARAAFRPPAVALFG